MECQFEGTRQEQQKLKENPRVSKKTHHDSLPITRHLHQEKLQLLIDARPAPILPELLPEPHRHQHQTVHSRRNQIQVHVTHLPSITLHRAHVRFQNHQLRTILIRLLPSHQDDHHRGTHQGQRTLLTLNDHQQTGNYPQVLYGCALLLLQKHQSVLHQKRQTYSSGYLHDRNVENHHD